MGFRGPRGPEAAQWVSSDPGGRQARSQPSPCHERGLKCNREGEPEAKGFQSCDRGHLREDGRDPSFGDCGIAQVTCPRQFRQPVTPHTGASSKGSRVGVVSMSPSPAPTWGELPCVNGTLG